MKKVKDNLNIEMVRYRIKATWRNKNITFKSTEKWIVKNSISIIAVFISIVSVKVSIVGYNLSKESYENSKIAIYKSRIVGDDVLEIIPYSEDIFLQYANVFFPTQISEAVRHVRNMDNMLYLTPELYNLQEYIDEKLGEDEENYQVGELGIPIIIESEYIYNGQIYKNCGLYSLDIMFIKTAYLLPRIEVNGILFRGYIVGEQNYTEILNTYFYEATDHLEN